MLARIAKWLVIGLAVLFVAIQAVRPARTNPPVEASRTIYSHVQVPDDVRAVLERSCRDCHSNETRWPWYSNVAPVSWFVIDHVNHARSHLNFSEWNKYDREEAARLLGGICKQVKTDEMPLPSYLVIHRGAVMQGDDRAVVCGWAGSARFRVAEGSN
jgi:hypothetical protein